MIKNINPSELIKTDLFIEEPVIKLNDNINNCNSKKIILSSSRYTGKTVDFHYNEQSKIYQDNISIYSHFDSIGTGLPNNDLYVHYYELLMSEKLLLFIEKNYNEIYEIYFKKYSKLIKKLTLETNKYIRNYAYKNTKISEILSYGEVSSLIVERLKQVANIKTITLLIDRFDWTDNRSVITQQHLSSYFELFDKTVISVDDDIDLEKKVRLENNGYSIFTTDYSKNPDFIKGLIEKRINYYNNNLLENKIKFPIEKITDEMYNYLVIKCNGNINMVLKILNDTNMFLKWTNGNFEFSNLFKIIDYEVEQNKTFQKMFCPPKFHL